MSKGLGQKIAIKFTEVLTGDVTGLVPAPLAPGDYFRPIGTATGSSQYSSYAPSRAFDGSTSSYWYTRTTGDQWVKIELAEPTWIYGFRWYAGSSYRPNGFDFQGSNDGENWEDILTGNSPNATGWHEFPADFPKQYKYYRWTITSRYSSYLYVYEIELLRAVGNEVAFTVTGKEYQYVNGPLIDKEYQVDKVERYPIQRVWELGDTLELDNVGGGIEIVGWNTNEFETGNPATGTRGYKFKPNNDCLVSKLRIFPTETTSTVHLWDASTQTLLATKTFATITGQWNEVVLDEPIQLYSNKEYIVSGNYTSGRSYYRNSNPSQSEFNELTLLGFFTSTSHNTFPTTSTTWGNAVDIVMQIGDTEFETPKIYLSEVIQLSGEYRIRWLENKPENTDVLLEYATGETQGQWQTVSNGEVINIDTNLWIRATLSTEDTTITPTLKDLWLEEASAPADQIRLVMHPQGRFNNVEGPLTVQYDQTVGSLRGRGGPVEGFTETFTPTDLEPKPNPHVAENLEVSAEVSVDFIKVTYNLAYEEEHLTVSASATVDFVYVGIINP